MSIVHEVMSRLYPTSPSAAGPETKEKAAAVGRVLYTLSRSRRFTRPDTLARTADTTRGIVDLTLETLPRLDVVKPRRDEAGRVVGLDLRTDRSRGVVIGFRRLYVDGYVVECTRDPHASTWGREYGRVLHKATLLAAGKGSTLIAGSSGRSGAEFLFAAGMNVLRLADALPGEAFAGLPGDLATLGHDPVLMLEAASHMDSLADLAEERQRLELQDAERLKAFEWETRKADAGLRTRTERRTVQTGSRTVERVRYERYERSGYWGEDREGSVLERTSRMVEEPVFRSYDERVRDYPDAPFLATRRLVEIEEETKRAATLLKRSLAAGRPRPATDEVPEAPAFRP